MDIHKDDGRRPDQRGDNMITLVCVLITLAGVVDFIALLFFDFVTTGIRKLKAARKKKRRQIHEKNSINDRGSITNRTGDRDDHAERDWFEEIE